MSECVCERESVFVCVHAGDRACARTCVSVITFHPCCKN